MDKLKKMALYQRVVELGSFAAAAADQRLTPAMVGRHVADLEQMLGLQLIRRTTRSMEVTEAGHSYYQGCKAMLAQLAALEHAVGSAQDTVTTGTIRVAAPDGLGPSVLMDAIAAFVADYPGMAFDLVLDNAMTDLVTSGADLTLRLAVALDDSSLIARELGRTGLSLYAAPAYLAANPLPVTSVDALREHACLCFSASRFGDSWPLLTASGVHKLRLSWRLLANQSHVYREAMLRGLGIGLLPDIMAADWVRAGTLARISGPLAFPQLGVYAVYPSAQLQPARVRRFLQVLQRVVQNSVCVADA